MVVLAQQTIQEQDTNLAELQTDITRLHKVTVDISHEVTHQNKYVLLGIDMSVDLNDHLIVLRCLAMLRMLDDLTEDVEEAQERMNFVMGGLSKLLKTKGTCGVDLHTTKF